ncbi:LysR-type transcriptional regulator [Bifidobacterium bifidum LMG 13195]|uniref:LysR-type transcriptional regulator n=1 Tax=Bifidobacterium bifidum LMG 13195 TaxID=1207542 RepID=A0A286TF52_BIFBI|nr:LysR-type transcriptional regulator [Bifidobacterium bifidum LMG 13195]
MLLMTLLQLKYIVKIVECGSMNEASHELYVSQPALSSSVKRDVGVGGERTELGIRESSLVLRSGLRLRVDGAELSLTYARQVLDQADLLWRRS